MTDTEDTGFVRAPDRYAGSREAIDAIRDSMTDAEFAAFCRANCMKYTLRAGKKPGSDDAEKARWYQMMADHVAGLGPDPREARPGFVPYQRPNARGIQVLDHGYVRLVESWGRGDAGLPEAGIIEAARQSTQGSFRGWEVDRRLLAYLHNNKHATPFEFAGMVLEIRAPIFVFREWHRHRTQSYNEASARYAPLPDLAYVPTVDRVMMAGPTRQGAGSGCLTREAAEAFVEQTRLDYAAFDARYTAALAAGVPKELARIGMPVGRYSQMRASANLRNWLAFLTLRLDPAAQWEIRQYAEAVASIVREQFPETSRLVWP